MKKVIIVGGGIAGLSTGVYAQKCGFDTTILESHSVAGGNCTSWKRGDYLFEGGMHWLCGSGKNDDKLNKLWRHVGALDDSVKMHYREPHFEYNYNGTMIRLFRNTDATERHLLEIAPEDTDEIKAMCGYIRKVKNLVLPIKDVKGVKVTQKNRTPLSAVFKILKGVKVLKAFSRISGGEYLARFKHEGLREFLSQFISEERGAFQFFFNYGILGRDDGGFPEGGSLPFVSRIVKTYTDLGGELRLSTPVERVIIENNRAVGVMVAGKRMDADVVIVTVDSMQMNHLFETPPKSEWLDKMKEVTGPTMSVVVALGINADMKNYADRYVFKLNKPLTLGTHTFDALPMYNYAADTGYSPDGKTAVVIRMTCDTYDFWKTARAENRYEEEKQKIADAVTEGVEAAFPEARGKIEVVDVATPLTYERYLNNWRGSWMTTMAPGTKVEAFPPSVEGLNALYFAGQRLQPPGGLPGALMTGRRAVQGLCRDTNTVFVSEDWQ